MSLSPDLLAYADQRLASTAEFLDVMVAEYRADVAMRGVNDPLTTIALAELMHGHSRGTLIADALSLAIRRLAAGAAL